MWHFRRKVSTNPAVISNQKMKRIRRESYISSIKNHRKLDDSLTWTKLPYGFQGMSRKEVRKLNRQINDSWAQFHTDSPPTFQRWVVLSPFTAENQ